MTKANQVMWRQVPYKPSLEMDHNIGILPLHCPGISFLQFTTVFIPPPSWCFCFFCNVLGYLFKSIEMFQIGRVNI